ncbi:MAG: transcription elongation factor GreA [Nitrospirae bacterium]|nr:transcription elongation factor GreA [Candidatus Troglogloeales bacterium]
MMPIPMTKNGYEKIKEEIARLKKIDRPKNIADIAEARAHGDLKENAEYHAAKERQSFIEGRLKELENKLASAEVISTRNLSTEKVVFGTTVLLIHSEMGEEKKYTLVGTEEADLKEGKISVQSPLGRSLIGHKVGEFVKVVTPAKTVEYEIIKISIE